MTMVISSQALRSAEWRVSKDANWVKLDFESQKEGSKFVAIDANGRQVRVAVRGDRDPGYGSTSKMIGECAVCLLRDAANVPAGIWTPGAAMGDRLIKRLTDHAGLTFSVEG